MKARALIGAAVAALAISTVGAAVANAAPMQAAQGTVSVAPYMVGNAAYFSVGSVNCGIQSTGAVGCDIPAGMAKWYDVIPVTDLAIDLPFLPAHPTFGLLGQYGRAGSPPLPEGPIGYGSTISYAGATCSGGGRGAISCTSMGHSFSFGWSGTQTS